MSQTLYISALVIAWSPPLLLFIAGVLPYPVMLAVFLTSMFAQAMTYMFGTLWWLIFSTSELTIQIVFVWLFYTLMCTITRSIYHKLSRRIQTNFHVIGSNAASYPIEHQHFHFCSGLGWGLSESSLIFIPFILNSASRAIILPTDMSCGIDIPSLFPAAISSLCLTLSHICYSYNHLYSHYFTSTFYSVIIYIFTLLCHYFQLVGPALANMNDICYGNIIIPISLLLLSLLTTWIMSCNYNRKLARYDPRTKIHQD